METVKERPIIFQGWGVVAIRQGCKTQTRRTQGLERINQSPNDWEFIGQNGRMFQFRCKIPPFMMIDLLYLYGVPGDRLWVRETFREFDDGDVFYRADFGKSIPVHADDDPAIWKWQSSMFMPRRLARTLLEITEVRVQRAQEISEDDAKAEGAQVPGVIYPDSPHEAYSYAENYKLIWDSINAKRGFGCSVKPWVWALTFKKIE